MNFYILNSYHFSNNHFSTTPTKSFHHFFKYVSRPLFSSFTTFPSCKTENFRIPFKYCPSPVTLMGTDCFTITQKKEWRLNSDTGRATESYKLCLQEQPAPHPSLLCNTVKKKKNQANNFTERILVILSYGSAKTTELTSTFGHAISFSLRSSFHVWFNKFLLTSFKLTVPSCTQERFANDCRFQCIVSLLEHASALFFINLLLLAVHVRLRNAGAGNRNCDTSISAHVVPWQLVGKVFFSTLWVFNLLTNSVPEHFIKDTLNLQWPRESTGDQTCVVRCKHFCAQLLDFEWPTPCSKCFRS